MEIDSGLYISNNTNPLSSNILVNFPIKEVGKTIVSIISENPSSYISNTNQLNKALNSFCFQIPTGLDGSEIRINLYKDSEATTIVNITATPISNLYTTPSDLQNSISEVQNVIYSKLNGASINEIKKLKTYSSGTKKGCSFVFSTILFICICILVLYFLLCILI